MLHEKISYAIKEKSLMQSHALLVDTNNLSHMYPTKKAIFRIRIDIKSYRIWRNYVGRKWQIFWKVMKISPN